MIRKIKNSIADANLRKIFSREFSPSKQAIFRARQAFMHEAFPYGSAYAYSFRTTFIRWTRYSIAAVAVIAVLNGGAAVYADTKDVPITHPLYRFKRIAESVELKAASPKHQTELEIKFAERRARELRKIEHEDDTGVAGAATTTAKKQNISVEARIELKKQLKEDIKARIKVIENTIKNKPETKKNIRKAIVCKNSLELRDDLEAAFLSASTSADVKAQIIALCKETLRSERENGPEIEIKQESSEKIEMEHNNETESKDEKRINILDSVKTNIPGL